MPGIAKAQDPAKDSALFMGSKKGSSVPDQGPGRAPFSFIGNITIDVQKNALLWQAGCLLGTPQPLILGIKKTADFSHDDVCQRSVFRYLVLCSVRQTGIYLSTNVSSRSAISCACKLAILACPISFSSINSAPGKFAFIYLISHARSFVSLSPYQY